MNNYEVVPNIISCKDLDYLSDMFEWNYNAFKKASNSLNYVQDQEIKNMIQKGIMLFKSNLEKTLEILNKGGNNE
ncbi:MAG: hypothetical protein J6A52_01410 [Bacilli bacterium]|nr:hypothetical protein [Bacilli bacterium]